MMDSIWCRYRIFKTGKKGKQKVSLSNFEKIKNPNDLSGLSIIFNLGSDFFLPNVFQMKLPEQNMLPDKSATAALSGPTLVKSLNRKLALDKLIQLQCGKNHRMKKDIGYDHSIDEI